jgi:SPP1 gp7 family putative phage head morphogenesis protein
MALHSSAIAREFLARRLLTGKRPKLRKRLPRQLEPVGCSGSTTPRCCVVLQGGAGQAAAPAGAAPAQHRQARRAGARRDRRHRLRGADQRAGGAGQRGAAGGVSQRAAAPARARVRQPDAGFPARPARQADHGRAGDRSVQARSRGCSDAMQQFASANVSLIKSIPQQFFQQIEQRLVQGVRAGQTYERAGGRGAGPLRRAESRAQLIARDQIGKLYGNVNEARQRDLGLKAYFWRTAQDERVREDHAAREGERFTWTDPPDDGHPGEPVQCRCWAEPDFSPPTLTTSTRRHDAGTHREAARLIEWKRRGGLLAARATPSARSRGRCTRQHGSTCTRWIAWATSRSPRGAASATAARRRPAPRRSAQQRSRRLRQVAERAQARARKRAA